MSKKYKETAVVFYDLHGEQMILMPTATLFKLVQKCLGKKLADKVDDEIIEELRKHGL